jgi:hypothetical protein
VRYLVLSGKESTQVVSSMQRQRGRGRVMSKLICHAEECDNSTSETFFHCEQHGGEDGEGESDGH